MARYEVRLWLAVMSVTLAVACGTARAQDLHVVNMSAVPLAQLAAVERSTEWMAYALHNAWGTPVIHWTADSGHFVMLAPPPVDSELSYHAGGAAFVWTADGVTSVVSSGPPLPWSVVFSHEVLEMLTDPYPPASYGPLSFPFEVCDPVLRVVLNAGGVPVDDFVTPAWFTPGSRGPWDVAGSLTGPFQTRR
jgi:hypothetical protein